MNGPRIVPTSGRIVLYCLSADDVVAINRRRTTSSEIREMILDHKWSIGAQAHIGNEVHEGDVFPGMVVRVWDADKINIQVNLDGNDVFWATSVSVSEEPEPGKFHWMPYQKQQAEKQA